MRYASLAASMLALSAPCWSADKIYQFCKKRPDAEKIILREPQRVYEYHYWSQRQPQTSKGSFKYGQLAGQVNFEGEPLRILGPGQWNNKRDQLTFQVRRRGIPEAVVFHTDNCRWPA